MPIPLGGSSGPPSITFPAQGTYVDVALVNLEVVPWTDFKTGKVKKTDAGDDRTQELLTGLVVRGTAGTGKGGAEPLVPGETVRIFIAGHRRWAFGEAKTEHKAATGMQLNVGDFMRVKYDRDEPGQGAEDKKVWTFQIRAPKPEELAQTTKCEQLHRGATAVPVGAPASGPASYGVGEEPF